MRISEVLKGVRSLYVESAPFIYYTEDRAEYADKMEAIFEAVYAGQMHAFTASITLTETLMKPLQRQDQELVKRYHDLFYETENIVVSAIDARIAEVAAQLRADHNLRTPDALHLASAMDSQCDAFLTNDKALKRVTAIPVLLLDDLELDPPDEGNEHE